MNVGAKNPLAMKKVVLLACGSFNPITNMHLRMFEIAKDALHKNGNYQVIGGIISPVNDSYGKKDLIPAKHRCQMVRMALEKNDWIQLDTWECQQSSWLETAKVLAHHKQNIINNLAANRKRKLDESQPAPNESSQADSNVELKLLCGADLLESFGTPGLWKDEDIEEIVGKFGLVCISRAGTDPQKFIYDNDVLTKHVNNIHLVTEWIQNEISSTKIRRALRRKESVRYLLQDSVIDYIHLNSLYGTAPRKANSQIILLSDSHMADNRQCYSFFCGRSVGFGGGGGGNAHLNDAENMRKKAEVQIVSASQ